MPQVTPDNLVERSGACGCPAVGKLVERVIPVRYARPWLSTAIALPRSSSEPPSRVTKSRTANVNRNFLTKCSLATNASAPPAVGPPAPFRLLDEVVPDT